MRWHEQSWPALQALNKNLPVVVPLGSCEQHGGHLPVFVDSIQVSAIAERAEQKLGERVLLLPTLWLGSSHHHLDYPGTVSILPSLYSEVIKSITKCILSAGFRRILFLNGHGGNKVPAAQALSELVCECEAADDAYLLLTSWWELTGESMSAGMDSPSLSHACEYETSLVFTLRPELVNLDQAREGPMALSNDWVRTEGTTASRVAMFRRFRRLTAVGSMGNPAKATAEKGQRILELTVDELVNLLGEIADWPDLPVIGPALP